MTERFAYKWLFILAVSALSSGFVHASNAVAAPNNRQSEICDSLRAPATPQSFFKDSNDFLRVCNGLINCLFGDDPQAYLGFAPNIELSAHSVPSAFALAPNRIAISRGLLPLIETPHELAFVLSHEIAHLASHNTQQRRALVGPRGSVEGVAAELEADQFALSELKKEQFDISAGAAILQRIALFGQTMGTPLAHVRPTLALRIAALRGK